MRKMSEFKNKKNIKNNLLRFAAIGISTSILLGGTVSTAHADSINENEITQNIPEVELSDLTLNDFTNLNNNNVSGPISGSFIQGWMVHDWTLNQWRSELNAMRNVGINMVILQSTVDLSGGSVNDSGLWVGHAARAVRAQYPSGIIGISNNTSNSLEFALQAAQENNMQVMIGLIDDASWWNHGWNFSNNGIESWRRWANANAILNNQVMNEIWSLYGSRFGSTIAGFYYPNEIWNFQQFNADVTEIIGGNIRTIRRNLTQIAPNLPLAISPFFNVTTTTTNPGQMQEQLTAILQNAQLRPIDILMPQDSVGPNSITIWHTTLLLWLTAYRNVANSVGVRFWVNHENFDFALQPANVNRLIQQFNIASQVNPEARVMFSWSHYWNPQHRAGVSGINADFRNWVNSFNNQPSTPSPAPVPSPTNPTIPPTTPPTFEPSPVPIDPPFASEGFNPVVPNSPINSGSISVPTFIDVNRARTVLRRGETLNAGEWLLSPNNLFGLTVQNSDGHVVLYSLKDNEIGDAVAATGSLGVLGTLELQYDGHLVQYLDNFPVSWTGVKDGSRLIVQDDGNVILFNNAGDIIWSRFGRFSNGNFFK